MADSKHLEEGSVPGRTAKVIGLFIACLALFSIVNVLTCPISWRGPRLEILLLACFGAIGAEACLHSMWCVLTPPRWVLRMATGIAAAFGLYCAWVVGYIVDERVYMWEVWHSDLTTAFCWLPLLLLSVQMPLWVAKYWIRWRVVHQSHNEQKKTHGSFGIRDLMIGTGAIALCLTMGKYGSELAGEGVFVGFVIATLVVMLVSTLTILPAVVATLRSRRLLVGLTVILASNTLVVAAYISIVFSFAKQFPPPEVYPQAVALATSFTVCVSGPLVVARWLGYRLRWGRE